MKPFRKHVALAIDGGGMRGIIITRALQRLEEAFGLPAHHIFRLTAGTSTGSIIAAGIAAKLSAKQMYKLYVELGPMIFTKTWRKWFFPLTRYRYDNAPLIEALKYSLGDCTMGDFWKTDPPTDVVITTFDLVENRTRFIKPWKEATRDWQVAHAVLASSSVPTYFPVVEGRFADGGVGSYANPCYLAAYELRFCLGWDPAETTLISLGTGRFPHHFNSEQANRLWAWEWINPVVDAFQRSAGDQQVHLVDTFFKDLDFRRFQIDLEEEITMDDVSRIPELTSYGDQLGKMIIEDQVDRFQGIVPKRVVSREELP
ncbi:MAG TPA: patatin-like phospholipase family protein [Anaerolineae bacterium]|nr:patatin-like phospholipase family protein [Anaerolineae bacterium]